MQRHESTTHRKKKARELKERNINIAIESETRRNWGEPKPSMNLQWSKLVKASKLWNSKVGDKNESKECFIHWCNSKCKIQDLPHSLTVVWDYIPEEAQYKKKEGILLSIVETN